jgi:hypothetical protein
MGKSAQLPHVHFITSSFDFVPCQRENSRNLLPRINGELIAGTAALQTGGRLLSGFQCVDLQCLTGDLCADPTEAPVTHRNQIGPAGLEPATPCLEGSSNDFQKPACFQTLPFQAVVRTVLKLVAHCCVWRLSTATNSTTF